jgi:hypothetical protein
MIRWVLGLNAGVVMLETLQNGSWQLKVGYGTNPIGGAFRAKDELDAFRIAKIRLRVYLKSAHEYLADDITIVEALPEGVRPVQ